MRLKTSFIFCFFLIFGSVELPGIELSEKELYVNALASMTYHLNHCRERYSGIVQKDLKEGIIFSDEDVQKLWDRICQLSPKKNTALVALLNYQESKALLESGNLEGAHQTIAKSYQEIDQLWDESIKNELGDELFNYAAERPTADYSRYPHLTREMKSRFAHYLISNDHSMKKHLDRIFGNRRVTANRNTFYNAGFSIISERPRSYVIVAKHKYLPNHLVKCYLDTEEREKWHKPSWHWLQQRCVGARVIRKIIESKNFRYFSVARKYLYLLPLLNSTVPYDPCYTRHPVILLVTDMNLVDKKDNLYAWTNIMDERRLDELYYIISRAKGASYRADNIAYSRSEKFCFIDTEYPGRGPEYYRIGRELNSKMANYWNDLVTKGGM